ncbi:MAG: hypothetical protein N4A44_02870 [Alphaproteobacteria bacterium]|nr:hypothetical protein [Alphaproteobacteria bacterium]
MEEISKTPEGKEFIEQFFVIEPSSNIKTKEDEEYERGLRIEIQAAAAQIDHSKTVKQLF